MYKQLLRAPDDPWPSAGATLAMPTISSSVNLLCCLALARRAVAGRSRCEHICVLRLSMNPWRNVKTGFQAHFCCPALRWPSKRAVSRRILRSDRIPFDSRPRIARANREKPKKNPQGWNRGKKKQRNCRARRKRRATQETINKARGARDHQP